MKWLGRAAIGGLVAGTYGVVIEAGFMLNTTVYAFTPPHWTPGLKLRVAVLSDPHLIKPHMTVERWQRIINVANAAQPDVTLLLGDFLAHHRFRTGLVTMEEFAASLSSIKAPLGYYAINGNHEWWDDHEVQMTDGMGPPYGTRMLAAAGVPLLNNATKRLEKDGKPFWLSGTDSTVAIFKGRGRFLSRAKLEETMASITDSAPVIHLAHEPDLFTEIPERVSLTLSGHTHGGQVRLFGYSPVVNSSYGNRYAYGHVIENGRHLIVSGGLGCSKLPMRIGVPPEIVLLELG